ncbi:MAG: hypothetical protein P8P30_07955 [Rickettsiales bacterium]|nr:hypothetical protein [Rickettsiales bacterium]
MAGLVTMKFDLRLKEALSRICVQHIEVLKLRNLGKRKPRNQDLSLFCGVPKCADRLYGFISDLYTIGIRSLSRIRKCILLMMKLATVFGCREKSDLEW